MKLNLQYNRVKGKLSFVFSKMFTISDVLYFFLKIQFSLEIISF